MGVSICTGEFSQQSKLTLLWQYSDLHRFCTCFWNTCTETNMSVSYLWGILTSWKTYWPTRQPLVSPRASTSTKDGGGGRQWFSKLVLLLSHSAHRKCFQKNPQGSCTQCRACPFCTVLHTLFSYTSVQPWDWWKPSQLHYSCVQLQFWTWSPPVTPVKQAGAQGVSAVSSQTPGFTCF